VVQPRYYPGIFLEGLRKINLAPLQYEPKSIPLHRSIGSHDSTEVVSKVLFYHGDGSCTFFRNVSSDLPGYTASLPIVTVTVTSYMVSFWK
jgi:hypothetical protein